MKAQEEENNNRGYGWCTLGGGKVLPQPRVLCKIFFVNQSNIKYIEHQVN